MSIESPYPNYSRAERIADNVIHVAGVMASMLAVPVLITLVAVWHGDFSRVTAVSIYGVSLIAMFAFSASYHLVSRETAKEILRRLDHSAIFVLIAGTYTPFAVLAGGSAGFWMLGGIWSAAAIGVSIQVLAFRKLEWVALLLYLVMGWAVILFGWPLLMALSTPTIVLISVGGATYTLGVVFHLWRKLPFQNAIWHGCVLLASILFYAAVLVENRMVALGA